MIFILIFLILFILFIFIYIKNKEKIDVKIKLEEAKKILEKIKNNKIILDEEFKNFPKYYINLERSKDRKNYMEKIIKEYDIKNIKRIEAFDGKKLNKKDYIADFWFIKNNELAISMSHIKAIKTAYEEGYNKAIIMEDDANFCLAPYWDKKFKDIINDIPIDCDILLLANNGNKDKIDIISHKKIKTRISGVCYLITLSGMKKLINNHIRDNKYFFDNKKLKSIVWDSTIIRTLNVYHTGKPLFLLYNFKFLSDKDHQTDDYFDKDSYNTLNNYF
jgi:GR25 family glycosyltransferase involved in LPS biosynthesis